jgi:hypothetical protein
MLYHGITTKQQTNLMNIGMSRQDQESGEAPNRKLRPDRIKQRPVGIKMKLRASTVDTGRSTSKMSAGTEGDEHTGREQHRPAR